jgi:hypothetical protein
MASQVVPDDPVIVLFAGCVFIAPTDIPTALCTKPAASGQNLTPGTGSEGPLMIARRRLEFVALEVRCAPIPDLPAVAAR